MIRILLAALFATFPMLGIAQGLQGENTPSNWVVRFFEPHGLWTTMCDEREEDGVLRQRCYIRHVDVFSPRPKFAAMFLFVTPEDDGPMVDFGMEPGTLFTADGFRIEHGDGVTWRTRKPGCMTGLRCRFADADGAALLEQMKSGGAFRFTFSDRHGAPRDLTWPLDGFDAAYDAFVIQSQQRGLM